MYQESIKNLKHSKYFVLQELMMAHIIVIGKYVQAILLFYRHFNM